MTSWHIGRNRRHKEFSQTSPFQKEATAASIDDDMLWVNAISNQIVLMISHCDYHFGEEKNAEKATTRFWNSRTLVHEVPVLYKST